MTTVENTKQAELGDFGKGLLPSLAKEFFSDLKRILGIPAKAAHKIAESFMANYGRYLALNADVSYRVSKANKDGMVTLSYAAKGIDKTIASPDLSLARCCVQFQALIKEGLARNCDYHDVLCERLVQYIDEHNKD